MPALEGQGELPCGQGQVRSREQEGAAQGERTRAGRWNPAHFSMVRLLMYSAVRAAPLTMNPRCGEYSP